MKKLVIYHGNCADGFTAAWVVTRVFGEDQVELFPGVYGEDPPNVNGREVIMVDFSYKRDVMERILEQSKHLCVLDHHVSAEAELASVDWRKGAEIHFDMAKSGAMLAWEWFRPHEKAPRLIEYVQDRDLWKFELTSSREVAAWVFSFHYNLHVWDDLAEIISKNPSVAIDQGAAILRKQRKDIAELLPVLTRWVKIRGHHVPVANLPYTLASDAASELCFMHRPAFAACYFDRKDMRVFSLRSLNEGEDVSLIARSYGGGGHKHAAGFQMPHDWLGDEQEHFDMRKR